ncbi:HET-domain-containing protein [Thozetella sp. PMI_491]|nr:HET-domain-containing protein [Thozetella sp. PMI_491]
MRLLDTEKLRLCEFADDAIPPYAILSHTWAREEVTLQDLLIGSSTQAAGFEYIWIDTCCIDKTDKAELSEAINSMYRWYQEALVCFAYLEDVCSTEDSSSLASQVSKSRWFTRGWTLQELIAPRKVHFIARDRVMLGTRISLLSIISDVTRIPVRFLLGDDIKNASIGQRLSWAAGRKTTKTEDMAYCLLGILRIHMPLLYGEREHAFIRLQEELMKAYDDQSILAWQSSSYLRSGSITRAFTCRYRLCRQMKSLNILQS